MNRKKYWHDDRWHDNPWPSEHDHDDKNHKCDKHDHDHHHDDKKCKCDKHDHDHHWHDDNWHNNHHHDDKKCKCDKHDHNHHWYDDEWHNNHHHDDKKCKCDKHDHDHHWHDDEWHNNHHHDDKKCKCDKHDHDHHWKKHKRCFDLYPGSPCCDDRFAVRLAGLEGGLNFRLRQLLGEDIELFVIAPEETVINGTIVEVGGDFVELKPKGLRNNIAKTSKGTTIVSFENIAKLVAPKLKKEKHHKYNKHEALVLEEFPHKAGCLCASCRVKRRKQYSKKKFM